MIASPSAFDPNADEETRKKVFERDGHCCQYCGFESQKFQLVHNASGLETPARTVNLGNGDNAGGNDISHLKTSCIFCHQCFHLDTVSDMKSGVLIWMPEISQIQLHHLARSIYVGRITQGPMAETARTTLEMIMKRREDAIARIKTDDTKILSLVLRDYITRDDYARHHEKLEGIRLFPLDKRMIREGDLEFNQFPQILAYWRSKDGPFAALNPNDWVKRYQELKTAA